MKNRFIDRSGDGLSLSGTPITIRVYEVSALLLVVHFIIHVAGANPKAVRLVDDPWLEGHD
ncbi:MAG TPA: hypothetical protein VNB95_00735, partial [Nitrososphaera sp.]|nr:hypothetical protein [Nitrososphaera sp.]